MHKNPNDKETNERDDIADIMLSLTGSFPFSGNESGVSPSITTPVPSSPEVFNDNVPTVSVDNLIHADNPNKHDKEDIMRTKQVDAVLSDNDDKFNEMVRKAIQQFKLDNKLPIDKPLELSLFKNHAGEKFIMIASQDNQQASNLQQHIDNNYWLTKQILPSEKDGQIIICRGKLIFYLERSFLWDKSINNAISTQDWQNVFNWFFDEKCLTDLAYVTRNMFLKKINDRASVFIEKIEDSTEKNNAREGLLIAYESARDTNQKLENIRPSQTAERKKRHRFLQDIDDHLDNHHTSTYPIANRRSSNSNKIHKPDVAVSQQSEENVNVPPLIANAPVLSLNGANISTEELINFKVTDLQSFELSLNDEIAKTRTETRDVQTRLFETATTIIKNHYIKLAEIYDTLSKSGVLTSREKTDLESIAATISAFRSNPQKFASEFYETNLGNLENAIDSVIKQITDLEVKVKEAESRRELISAITNKFGIYKQWQVTLTQTKEMEQKLKTKYSEEASNTPK